MLSLWKMALSVEPKISVCCGCSPNRDYMLKRAWAEMAAAHRGLPVEFLCGYLDEEWNESRCKNFAAHHAKASRILFTNSDIYIPRKTIQFAMSFTHAEPWQLNIYRVDEQADGWMVENNDAIGDCQIVERSLWEQAKFDERLTGWGFIDYSFSMRCEGVGAKLITLPGPRVVHRWHPRLSDEKYREMNDRNRRIALGI